MQSLWNKTDILQTFLEQEKQIQVLCISETWLNKEKEDLLEIPGYTVSSSFCRTQHIGGGVLIAVINGLECHDRPDISSISVEKIIEISAVELPQVNILLLNIYLPNSKRDIDVYYSRLEYLLKQINNKVKTKM